MPPQSPLPLPVTYNSTPPPPVTVRRVVRFAVSFALGVAAVVVVLLLASLWFFHPLASR